MKRRRNQKTTLVGGRMFVGPFSTIDADTGESITRNRAHSSDAAFDRGDRYAEDNPGRDFRVIDAWGNPVPRPHVLLPTTGGAVIASPAHRYLAFRAEVARRRNQRQREARKAELAAELATLNQRTAPGASDAES